MYDGMIFKVPIFMCNQDGNYKGKLFSLGIVAAANLAALGSLKFYKSKKKPNLEKKYQVEYGHYI